MIGCCKMQAGSIGKSSSINNNGNLKDKGRLAKMKTSVSVVAQPPRPATSTTTRPLLFKENNNNNVPVLVREFQKITTTDDDHEATHNNIDSQAAGKFGIFGGMFVPETIVPCLHQLEAEFNRVLHDEAFQEELAVGLRDFVGRETPLYHAERLSEFHKSRNGGKGPEIFLKREDLSHGGSHKMNNALAQAMLAKCMGRTAIVTATATGQHGLATAAACARLGLDCTIFMATTDMERQYSNVDLMRLLGGQVEGVEGRFKDAASEAMRRWVGDLERSYHLTGTAVGPHPCPTMAREFQSVIGKETRRQAMERWGGKPHALVASVGTGTGAMGLFHEFMGDLEVRMVGVEAGGFGLESGIHASSLGRGEVGVYHGAMSYVLQDEYGQIKLPHSVAVGMQNPGVSPELSFLKETGRAEFYSATDQEALDAYRRLCKLEGIFASLEASHALAILDKLVPTFPNGSKVVVNCSGRGDKDADIVTLKSTTPI